MNNKGNLIKIFSFTLFIALILGQFAIFSKEVKNKGGLL